MVELPWAADSCPCVKKLLTGAVSRLNAERLERLRQRRRVRAVRVIQAWMRTEIWPKQEGKMLHAAITIQVCVKARCFVPASCVWCSGFERRSCLPGGWVCGAGACGSF